MRTPLSHLLLCLSLASFPASAQQSQQAPLICEISHYGAIPNDGAIDDRAIDAAINACAGGGGTVFVPNGVFLTGGVQLRSNMTLHLAGGAVLRGAERLDAYRRFPRANDARVAHERGETNPPDERLGDRGILHAIGVRNVLITGPGAIDGSGERFWNDTRHRPTFSLDLGNCRNVRIRDVTFLNPATYHVRTDNCDDVVFDGLAIRAPPLSPNSDGLQIRDSADIRISNCLIETGDDAIVLKSRARAVERIAITNCRLSSDDAAIKFGTGSAVAIRNIAVSNVIITSSRYGVALFMQDGGVYENVRFSDMIIETGGRHARAYPIFLDIDTRGGESARLGGIAGIVFDGLEIRTSGNILIGGQDGAPIRNVSLSDVRMHVREATDLRATAGKPRGNRALARSALADFSGEPAHVVVGHAVDVHFSNVRISEADRSSARQPLALRGTNAISGEPTIVDPLP